MNIYMQNFTVNINTMTMNVADLIGSDGPDQIVPNGSYIIRPASNTELYLGLGTSQIATFFRGSNEQFALTKVSDSSASYTIATSSRDTLGNRQPAVNGVIVPIFGSESWTFSSLRINNDGTFTVKMSYDRASSLFFGAASSAISEGTEARLANESGAIDLVLQKA